jgi:hypothetical protein
MNRRCGVCLVLGSWILLAACAPRDVSFSADVQPILRQYCQDCHVPGGAGHAASGFDMSTYESLMKGGKHGPFVIPGDPLTSTLNVLVEGRAHPSIRMPHGRGKLTGGEIEMLRVWVQEGATNN